TYTYTPQDRDSVYATLLSDIECAAPKPAESNKVTITVNPAVEDLVITADIVPIACFGESTGGINLTVTGGIAPYSFLWNTGATTQNLSDLPAGTYTVTVTDDAGVSLTQSFVLTDPAEISLSFTKVDVGYSSDPIGSINLSVAGGTGSYTYAWSGPDGYTATTQDIQNLP